MLEILLLGYFIKQIRKAAEEKGIKAKKWIIALVASWFAIETLTFVIAFTIFHVGKDEIFMVMIPAIIIAAIVAFFILEKVKHLQTQKV